jgi:hypothetical protein
MLLVYYALHDHHRAASFVRMSSQLKWHAGALVWPSPQSSHVTGPRFVNDLRHDAWKDTYICYCVKMVVGSAKTLQA